MSTTPQAVGISWECATSSHGGCGTGGCRCACHYRPTLQKDSLISERVTRDIGMLPTPPNDAPENLQAADSGKKCSKCGAAPNSPDDKFCRKDGTPLTPSVIHCGSCGQAFPPSDLYCGNCGTPLTTEVVTVNAKKRKQ